MADENDESRTEAATPRRREDARKEGQVARSQDLGTGAALCGAMLALIFLGPKLALAIYHEMARGCGGLNASIETSGDLQNVFLLNWGPALAAFALIALLILIGGMLVSFFQVGWHPSLDYLQPKWERVDPMAGFGRIFSMDSLFALGAGFLKLGVVLYAAYACIRPAFPAFIALYRTGTDVACVYLGGLAGSLGWSIAGAALAIGAADYGYRFWRHEKSLRMTREEVKEEFKQEDGDPHVKQRIRQLQRQRAMKRMMAKVPQATVVIMNPTHYAVALRYEPGAQSAPEVVAKGQNLVALRIRAMAEEHGIAVVEDPPLARALYKVVEPGQLIPPEFYQAIARLLAVILRPAYGPRAPQRPMGQSATENLAASPKAAQERGAATD